MSEHPSVGEPSSDPPVVRAEFNLTREEFDRFMRWQLRHSGVLRSQALLVVLLAAAAALVLVAVSPALGVRLLAICALTVGALAWGLAVAPGRVWARRGHDLGARQIYEFRADGVRRRTAETESTIQWSHYTRLVQRDGLYLLGGRSGRSFQVIPKRAFDSAVDDEAFRRLVGTHLPVE